MPYFMLHWWQTWQCTSCGMETRFVPRAVCRRRLGAWSVDTACPLGVVPRWRWLRRVADGMRRHLTPFSLN